MNKASDFFSKAEIERYSRHLILPEFNIEGQIKLKKASVLVVGAGGLGSPVLLYLAAAGVGRIGIVDFDTVDYSNLQRQVLFNVRDVGTSKAQTARNKILELNPHIHVEVFEERLTSENALRIFRDYDIVADGTDNFATRYLVNDACVLSGKVNVYASIYRFDGQVSVFNLPDSNGGRGPNYRDLYPEPPPPELVPSCAEGGVLGVLPGIIGTIQANEVIKTIAGIGETLSGRLFLFDSLNFETRIMKVRKSSANPLTGNNPTITELIDYEFFCRSSVAVSKFKTIIHEINPLGLKAIITDIKNEGLFQIIDIREPYEYAICSLPYAELITYSILTESIRRIRKDIPVYIYCKQGIRSAEVIDKLQHQFGYTNLCNLTSGIQGWADMVDNEMPKY